MSQVDSVKPRRSFRCWKENKYWAKLIYREPLVLLLTDNLHKSSNNGGRGKKEALPGAVMLFDFVVFLLFSLCVQPPSWMGLGCRCGIGVSLWALPEHGGSCVPTPASGLEAAAPLLSGGWLLPLLPCAGASARVTASHGMGKEDLHIPSCHLYLPTKSFLWPALCFSSLSSAVDCSHP